jgi:hypothetical protein
MTPREEIAPDPAEAGAKGSIARQLLGSSHRAKSAKALLPALADLHAAVPQLSQARQSERIL